MTRNRHNRGNTLPDEIMGQFGSVGTARFLRTLPPFKLDNGMPERFQKLLAELDRAEADRLKAPSRNMTEI